MSVSSVYETDTGSPKYAVRVRYSDHVSVHRFYSEADAEAFKLGALEPPTRLEAAVEKANEAIDSGESYSCIVALADLLAAVEHGLRIAGRA